MSDRGAGAVRGQSALTSPTGPSLTLQGPGLRGGQGRPLRARLVPSGETSQRPALHSEHGGPVEQGSRGCDHAGPVAPSSCAALLDVAPPASWCRVIHPRSGTLWRGSKPPGEEGQQLAGAPEPGPCTPSPAGPSSRPQHGQEGLARPGSSSDARVASPEPSPRDPNSPHFIL